MKKILATVVGLIVAALALTLTCSCQKDINLAKSLVDTTWSGSNDEGKYELTFNTMSTCSLTVTPKKGTEEEYIGDFVLVGARNSLAGESITIHGMFGTSWPDQCASGKFNSDTELVFGNLTLKKELE